MKLRSPLAILATTTTTTPAVVLGFVAPTTTRSSHYHNRLCKSLAIRVSSSGVTDRDMSSVTQGIVVADGPQDAESAKKEQRVVMSTAIPFLECPPLLKDCTLAGNYGFDPLELSKTKEQLWRYREMEIKHARLAMLGAVGWPLAEVVNRMICSYVDNPVTLHDGGHVPSVLNDGLAKIPPQFWGFCLGMTAAIDLYAVAIAARNEPGYFPGNLGFDPLKLYPTDVRGQERLKLAEIKHGRVSMLAVVLYAIEEMITKLSVVDETPFLFRFAETVEEVVDEVVVVEEAFQAAGAAI
jgi:hypothetical protein